MYSGFISLSLKPKTRQALSAQLQRASLDSYEVSLILVPVISSLVSLSPGTWQALGAQLQALGGDLQAVGVDLQRAPAAYLPRKCCCNPNPPPAPAA